MSAPQTPHTTGPLRPAAALVADHSRVFGPKWCQGLIDNEPVIVAARLVAVQAKDFYPRDRAGDAGGQG